MSKIPVTKVSVTRTTGPDLFLKEVELDSIKTANHFLLFQEHSFPYVGYDLVHYVIMWQDGQEYEGVINAMNPENPMYQKSSNSIDVKSFFEFALSNTEYSYNTKDVEAMKNLLTNYEFN